jgi:hypothetical protein
MMNSMYEWVGNESAKANSHPEMDRSCTNGARELGFGSATTLGQNNSIIQTEYFGPTSSGPYEPGPVAEMRLMLAYDRTAGTPAGRLGHAVNSMIHLASDQFIKKVRSDMSTLAQSTQRILCRPSTESIAI